MDSPRPWSSSDLRALGALVRRRARRIGALRKSVATLHEATADERALALAEIVLAIDRVITEAVNSVFGAKAFVRLESAWRGVQYLADMASGLGTTSIILRVINASWKALASDAEFSSSPRETAFHRLIFTDGLDTPNAEPYSILVGDYSPSVRQGEDDYVDDVGTLRSVAYTCQRAMAPIIMGVGASFFGLEPPKIELLASIRKDIGAEIEGDAEGVYTRWHQLRTNTASKFVAFVLPGFLLRSPRPSDMVVLSIPRRLSEGAFMYGGQDPTLDSSRCWGNAAIGLASVFMRSFAQSGWFAEAKGMRQTDLMGNYPDGGMIQPGVIESFDEPNVAPPKPMTQIVLTHEQEARLVQLGIIPLCAMPPVPAAAVYAAPMIYKPVPMSNKEATIAQKLSCDLHHVLAACRVGHMLLSRVRASVGKTTSEEEVQGALSEILAAYTSSSGEFNPRLPLRSQMVEVRPGDHAGEYVVAIRVAPVVPPIDVEAAVELVTTMRGDLSRGEG